MPHLSTDTPLCTVFYISKDVSSALLVVQPKLHFLSSSSTLHSSVNPIGFTSNMCLAAQCPTLCDVMDYSRPGSSVHGDSPGKHTGVGCLALLQGIFPTQGWNPGLPHCRQILYQLSYQGILNVFLFFVFKEHFNLQNS